MVTARSAIAYLAIILTVAALVFAKNAGAASGNVQICQPGANCKIGEFLYNDSYSPITDATCNITSRYPDNTSFLSAVNMPVSAEGDGWYAYSFTAPSTLGLYRTTITCVTGGETLTLDKSFEVQTATSTLTTTDVAGAVWNSGRSSYTTSGSFGAALQNITPGASDVATSVWGYSGRTLTGFGTLVTDIWANTTRTLTGTTLSSGSLATKDDVTTTTNITNVTNTTNNLLEQLINRPAIEQIIEESSLTTTTELQSKLEKSEDNANQLLTSGTYIKSKANLIKGNSGNIARTVGQLEVVVDSMFGQIGWITEQWDLPIASKLQSQNQKIAASLKAVGSTSSSLKNLLNNVDNFLKLVGTSNDTAKSNTLFGQLKARKELLSSLDQNYLQATELVADIGKNSRTQTDLVGQINTLSTQVVAINQLPKMNKTILSLANTKMDQKQLKNKTLSLRGIVNANRQFLAQKPNEPLRSLWFEEGSIVFKTLISNPSKSISQKVPLKYYLPKEVTRENIVKTDAELTINYDTEKDQYFVSGNFTLDPGETKTLTVTVDDSTFRIDDVQIATIRKQAEELSKPLEHTAYFAQGVTLKTDINSSCDKMESLQKNATTPEAKIRGYREAMIEYKAAKEKLDKLKEITTNAGSVGTLFGFVGGAQALAVWGLIIIMAAGFVFLALYMRALRGSERYSTMNKLSSFDDNFENYEEVGVQPLKKPLKNRLHFPRPVKYLTVILISVLIGGSSIYALGNLRQGQVKHEAVQTTTQVLGSTKENKASDSAQLKLDSTKEINVLVPEDSTVAIFSQPSINSLVLTSLKASRKAKEISHQDIWVKVSLQDPNGKEIEGWVDGDFIETETEVSKPNIVQSATVTVKNTPTGFLRVRKTPGGEEITMINPGEQYPLVKEQTGWVQIILEDGTSGWVSKQYVNF